LSKLKAAVNDKQWEEVIMMEIIRKWQHLTLFVIE
jgi:hypothetical protein